MIPPHTITCDEALAILHGDARPLGVETVRLAKAGRRVLAEPVSARIDIPRYDAAAMDGFAVRSTVEPAPEYQIVGASYPGEPWSGQIAERQAVRIMTGAEVPSGADRVVPFEMADTLGDVVRIPIWPSSPHVRSRGSDVMMGQEVLPAGAMLGPRPLLVAGAADVDMVRAWKRPVVSVIASGDELVPPGSAGQRDYAVPDSLTEAILLLARQYDAKPGDAALVPDDSTAIRVAAEAMLADADVLVIVGGASRGDRDFAKAGLEPLGLEIRFAGVSMKPGKPVWYGRIAERFVIGLPGNPTAAMTVARLFLVPLLRALGGRDFDGALRWNPVALAAETQAGGGRESFLCGTLIGDTVQIIERQSASAQLMLAKADVLVRVPANAGARAAGEYVDVLRF